MLRSMILKNSVDKTIQICLPEKSTEKGKLSLWKDWKVDVPIDNLFQKVIHHEAGIFGDVHNWGKKKHLVQFDQGS